VVHTLRTWGVRMDETFFLGGIDKAPVLAALRPHIFFDDQLRHLRRAQQVVPSAHVVPEREQLHLFGEEAVTADARVEPLVVIPPAPRSPAPRSPAPANPEEEPVVRDKEIASPAPPEPSEARLSSG
jgi:hypothetical protein